MKLSIPLTIFFTLFSGVFLLMGGLFLMQNLEFVKTAELTTGNITGYSMRSDSDGTTYSPQFSYVVGEKEYSAVETISSNIKPYDIGEEVPVLYNPAEPGSAKIKNTFNLYIFPSIFIGVAVVIDIIYVGYIVYVQKRKKEIEMLKTMGQPIQATLQQVGHTNYKENGRHKYRIYAQWTNTSTNSVQTFKSEPIAYDPSQFVSTGQLITVYIDPANSKKYWVDTSFLPNHQS